MSERVVAGREGTGERLARVRQMLSAGGEWVGRGCTIAQLTTTPGVYPSSFGIEDVGVKFSDGSEARLVLKDLSPGAVPAAARGVKPGFLVDPRREIETYRNVLGPFDIGAPKMVGAVADEAAGCYLLLLEAARGVPLWQVGEMEAWRAAARWLARTHARFTGVAGGVVGAARLLRYDEHYYARWLGRAESAVAAMLASERGGRRVVRVYASIITELLALPATFIHGEFHASNVLVEVLPASVTVTPLDWEMAALAPGLMDLADLTAGKWTAGQRESLAGAYRDALATCGAPPVANFDRALDCCRLHRAVQWLSWSRGWSPPQAHAQDWLGEATRACERLGLA